MAVRAADEPSSRATEELLLDSAVAHAAKGDWQAAIAESGRAHETWESHLRSRAASGAAMDSPMASVDAAVESSLRSLEGTNVSAKEWTPPARAAADSAAAVPPVGTNVAAKEWTPSAATAPPARAAVPPAHPWERVPGGDVNRIFGVVESLQADSGYLRRARHPTANSRDYEVHFRSRDAPEFERLEVGTEVEFTLVDYYGTASATDVAPAAARPAAVRAGGTGSLARPAQRPAPLAARTPSEIAAHLRALAGEVLALCDVHPEGAVLCANLPRLYHLKYRKALDLQVYGAAKMSVLVSHLPGVHFGGTHRAEVSRRGTGLGVGDDTVDDVAVALRAVAQRRVRAHLAARAGLEADAPWDDPEANAAGRRAALWLEGATAERERYERRLRDESEPLAVAFFAACANRVASLLGAERAAAPAPGAELAPRASPSSTGGQGPDAAGAAPPPPSGRKAKGYDPTVCTASPEQLDGLATEVLRLVDAAPSGTVLCANLPRLYYLKYRKALDLKAYGAYKMSALVSKLPGVHFGGTHRAEVSRKGTGLGVGDDPIDASALAIREETQARVRAHRAERDAAASGALRYFDPSAAEDAARWAAGCREVVVLMPGSRRADRPPGLPHDSVALLKQPGAWPGSFLLRCDPEAYRRDRRGVLDELTRVVGAAALRVESWGLAGDPPGEPAPAGLDPAAAEEARRARVREERLRDDEAAARRLDAEDRSSQPPRPAASAAPARRAAGGAPTSGDAAPASAPLPRAAPRPATSAFDRVSKPELQRRVKAFADAQKLDGKCRRTLEAYAVRDADSCARFLRAAPGELGDHVKDRNAYVEKAVREKHLLAASAGELKALTPELRSVADALALTSDVAKALKKLSLAQQRRAAERLADPAVMFGVLARNAFVLAELKKKEGGRLQRDDLGNGRVDVDLVAAVDGIRLSKNCYHLLRDLNRKKQALCALALESADFSKLADLSDFIEKGLNKGTLLRKGQELMAARTARRRPLMDGRVQTEAFETATRAAGRLEPMLQSFVEAAGVDVGAWADLVVVPWDAQRALFKSLRAANDDPARTTIRRAGGMASLVSEAAAAARRHFEALPAPRDEDDVPEEFLCPISMEVMTDPVIAADGHTYERRAIEAWFGRAHTSPTTNAPLPHLNLIPAHTIKSLIQRHLEQGV